MTRLLLVPALKCRVGRDPGRPTHDGRNADAAFVDLALVAAKSAVGVKLLIRRMLGAAVVGLEDDQRVIGHRIGRSPSPFGVFQSRQDIAEVRVDAGDHRGPLLALLGQRSEMGVAAIGLVPFGQPGDFAERSVRNLDGQQTKERLAGGSVVLRLGADEVEGRERIDIIAIGGGRIVGMVLQCRERPDRRDRRRTLPWNWVPVPIHPMHRPQPVQSKAWAGRRYGLVRGATRQPHGGSRETWAASGGSRSPDRSLLFDPPYPHLPQYPVA